MAIEEGNMLPDIELAGLAGRVRLADFAGRPLVLYFYPKDDTPGCTREAQDFGALMPEFETLGVAVLGVSKDPPTKHRKFIDKYELTVPLASDDTDAAMAAFGVWVEKRLYGKTYMGIDRSTFLFDAQGRLARAWRKVRVPGHVNAVLDAAKTVADG